MLIGNKNSLWVKRAEDPELIINGQLNQGYTGWVNSLGQEILPTNQWDVVNNQLVSRDSTANSYLYNEQISLADFTKRYVFRFTIVSETANFGVQVRRANYSYANLNISNYYTSVGVYEIVIPAYTEQEDYRMSFWRYKLHTGEVFINNISLQQED